MAKPAESAIRDYLAQHPEVIEEGLDLIGKEVILPAQDGDSAGGRVDLLFRDRRSKYLLVELKRAEQTARQAAHEVLKYTQLFLREYRCRLSDFRIMVLSTHTRELSTIARELMDGSPAALEFAVLDLPDGPEVVSPRISAFLPPPADIERRVSRRHFIFTFSSPEQTQAGCARILDHMQLVSLPECYAFQFTAEFGPLGLRTALYVAPIVLESEYCVSIISKISGRSCEEVLHDEQREGIDDFDDLRAINNEELFFCKEPLFGHDHFEIGYPEKAVRILSALGGFPERVIRLSLGRGMEEWDPLDLTQRVDASRIILEICRDNNLEEDVRSVNLASKPEVGEALEAIAKVLSRNEAWRRECLGVVGALAGSGVGGEVFYVIRDNDDLLASILTSTVGPPLHQRVVMEFRGTDERLFVGYMAWDGDPNSLEEVMARSEFADPMSYLLARHFHELTDLNQYLASELGLRFALGEIVDGDLFRVHVIDGVINRDTEPVGATLADFGEAWAGDIANVLESISQHDPTIIRLVEPHLQRHAESLLRDRVDSCGESYSARDDRWIGALTECDLCGRDLSSVMFMADAAVAGPGSPWGNLCPHCTVSTVECLGLGRGQLYVRDQEGWRLVLGGGKRVDLFPDVVA